MCQYFIYLGSAFYLGTYIHLVGAYCIVNTKVPKLLFSGIKSSYVLMQNTNYLVNLSILQDSQQTKQNNLYLDQHYYGCQHVVKNN